MTNVSNIPTNIDQNYKNSNKLIENIVAKKMDSIRSGVIIGGNGTNLFYKNNIIN